jgi:hypothetical protein
MKRAASAEENGDASKRARLADASDDNDDDPFPLSAQCSASKLCGTDAQATGANDRVGWLRGRVTMRWPPMGAKRQLVFSCENVENPSAVDTLTVIFVVGSWVTQVPGQLVDCKIGDQLSLGLKGAVLENKKMNATSLGLVLRYKEGVVLKKNDDPVLNTWNCELTGSFANVF